MMSDSVIFPDHHPSDALLLSYASGGLAEGFGVVIASHLEMCAVCRADVAVWEHFGGALLEQSQPQPMRDDALDLALARLDTEGNHPTERRHLSDDGLPSALSAYLPEGLAGLKWRGLGRGVKQAILPVEGAASLRLLSIPPGLRVPDHGHGGLELTLVLQGAFQDGARRFGPGDMEIADETLEHHPEALDTEPCLCLAATDAPLRLRGMIPRLAQPFLKI